MPGEISIAYDPPICQCGHFKQLHTNAKQLRPSRCLAPECQCTQYTETDLSDTALGQTLEEWLTESLRGKKRPR